MAYICIQVQLELWIQQIANLYHVKGIHERTSKTPDVLKKWDSITVTLFVIHKDQDKTCQNMHKLLLCDSKVLITLTQH